MILLKNAIIIALTLCFSFYCFAKEKFTISKPDFVEQFSNPDKIERIYCSNDKGEKIWVDRLFNTPLHIKFQSDRLKTIRLSSARHRNDSLIGYYSDTTKEIDRNKLAIPLSEINSIYIVPNNYIRSYPYYNLDSLNNAFQLKADSLYKSCVNNLAYKVYLSSKTSNDTVVLMKEICYNINFKDGNTTQYGVIKNLTEDSITVSNRFNVNQAKFEGVEYLLFNYAISEIKEIEVLKSGGFAYEKRALENYTIEVVAETQETKKCPLWYTINYFNQDIRLNRIWLAQKGFFGISEKEGKIYWNEK